MQQPDGKVVAFHERTAIERDRPLRVSIRLELGRCKMAALGLLNGVQQALVADALTAKPQDHRRKAFLFRNTSAQSTAPSLKARARRSCTV
ncbi:hypothetical protein D3C86_1976400 [compost metagenome]